MIGPTDAVGMPPGTYTFRIGVITAFGAWTPLGSSPLSPAPEWLALAETADPPSRRNYFSPFNWRSTKPVIFTSPIGGNSRVRKITPAGTITTVAGGGATGLPGDGGPATAATIGGNLYGVAVDGAGNLYITSNARIRKVDAASGNIFTIAGDGTPGFSGDGGWAGMAEVNGPQSIAVDASGNVYFADENNLRVRQLTPVQIVKEGVFNGATFLAGGVAPGEIVTIYGGPGVSLGPATR